MAKTRRVHEIAKELGVGSKAILEKCKAEGIPDIETHMSPVKLGLEQTIREWFSESHDTKTAVETSEQVDLTKARKTRRRRAKELPPPPGDPSAAAAVSDAPETIQSPVDQEPPATEEPVSPAVTVEVQSPAPAVSESTPAAAQAVAPAPTPEDSPAAVASAKVAPAADKPAMAKAAPHHPPVTKPAPSPTKPVVTPMGSINVPTRPKEIKPVGQKLMVPAAAKLSGPKVVRVEKADPIERPRPRRAGPGGGPQSPGGAAPSGSGTAKTRGPARGRGVISTVGAGEEESEGKPGNVNKRRSLTTRRGRFAEAPISAPTKFTEADLAELDARMHGATGYIKRRRTQLTKKEGSSPTSSPAVSSGRVEVSEPITIKSLSSAAGIKSTDIIKYLFKKGVMATINSAIAPETAMEAAMEFNIELVVKEQQTAEQLVVQEFENRPTIDLRRRPPVVTVMGHVDHGKTSLLDRIRSADVAAHESGGITQHVGAYRVTIKGTDGGDKTVVFLDTPGHEAFTSMRARGAGLTDLVVLVVAADDGVMPQTVESINHAKAAGVPIIVALNKIDKPEATESNIRKIYGQLAEHGLNPTEWGGSTEVIKVSATVGTGVTELMEVLDYQSELLDLKADYAGNARGVVVESQMQPGRGPVARVLVQQGHLKVGAFVVVGRAFGRVRDMSDDRGRLMPDAGPATPLEISGIDMIPDAGDKFYVTDSLQQAERIAVSYRERERLKQLASQTKVTLETLAAHLDAGKIKELRVVLKADVQGSIDVLRKSLTDLSTTELSVKVLHAAVGGVTESDVLLADASDAVIIGFHVIAPAIVRDLAEQRQVEIRLYRIIYEVTDEVRKALEGMLDPESKEEQLGVAEVRDTFKITKVGTVAGCMVTEGVMQRNAKVRVTRNDVVLIDERQIESLRRLKEDVKEARQGFECGIRLAGFDDIKTGDKLICYNVVTVKRKLV